MHKAHYIIGQIQSGRAGFGLGDSWKAWGKATLTERRQMKRRRMVSSSVRKQEKESCSSGFSRKSNENE